LLLDAIRKMNTHHPASLFGSSLLLNKKNNFADLFIDWNMSPAGRLCRVGQQKNSVNKEEEN
jgi:hypothetical protein